MQTDDTDVGVGPIEADDGKRSVEEIVQHMHEAANANATDPRASEEEKRVWAEHIELCTELRCALEAADRARKPGYRQVTRKEASQLVNDYYKNLKGHGQHLVPDAMLAALRSIGAVIPDAGK